MESAHEEEQYLTLSSKYKHDGETHYDFTNTIPYTTFSGLWEVALCELSYIKGSAVNWAEHAHFWTVIIEAPGTNAIPDKYRVTPTVYASVMSDAAIRVADTCEKLLIAVIDTIDNMVSGSGASGYLSYTIDTLPDGTPGSVIKRITTKKGCRIGFSKNIAHILNLTRMHNDDETGIPNLVWFSNDILQDHDFSYDLIVTIPRDKVIYTHRSNFKPVEEIHVLCDVVPNQIYGSTAKRMLACTATAEDKPVRSIIKHVFKNRQYVPLLYERLEMIKITVEGDEGQKDIVYDGGHTHLVLHIRPSRYNYFHYPEASSIKWTKPRRQ